MIGEVTWRMLFLLAVFTAHAAAAISTFFVGTYTSPGLSQGIYVGTLDLATGELGELKLAAREDNPNFLAISPDHRFIFAALADSVESFRVQPDSTLVPINKQPSGGGGSCHISVDRTGHVIFAANYDTHNVASFPVGKDGTIGPRASLITFTGSGPDPHRQQKPFAHSIYPDPEDRFAYACDLGTDSVWIFKLGPGGLMTPTTPPAAKVPPGSGPRHLAFGAGGKFVYVVNEMGVDTTVFSRDTATGALTPLETVSNLWPGVSAQGLTSAEIVLHPSGKWLYVSNRGHDTISVFAVGEDGRLKLVQNVPSPARFPRNFAIDPTGRWLIAAGQSDNRIAVLKIDPGSGELTATNQSASVGSPVCVVFVPDSLLTILQ